MEGFQISLNATTEQQRSKLAQWAKSRTRTHVIIPGDTTTFAGVFVEPVDFDKFCVTFARNSKNWQIDHVKYKRNWIKTMTVSEYNDVYKEHAKQLDAQKRDRINHELQQMGRFPVGSNALPDHWDLSDTTDADDFLRRVRLGRFPSAVSTLRNANKPD